MPVNRTRNLAAGYRSELLVVGVLALTVIFVLPDRPPLGIYLVGMASGGALALHGLAIVLVYRTNKFLNFAQLQFAAFAATIFAGLVNGRPLLRLFGAESRSIANGINFTIAVLLTLAITIGGTVLVYQTLIRRFANAPRIMPTLVTIFLAQALLGIAPTVLGWLQPLPSAGDLGRGIPNGAASGPVDFSWTVGEIELSSANVLTLVLVIVGALAITLYLRRSSAGVAIRAAGENPDRARTLGLDVFGVTTRVWMLVGVLAAVAGILQAFVDGAPIGDSSGGAAEGGGGEIGVLPVGELVLILAVAVVARFSSLPMAVLGGFVLGVVRTGVQWSFNSTVLFDAGLVLLIGVLLLLQRDRRTRAHREEDVFSLEAARESHPVPPELRRLGVVRQWSQTGIALGAIVLIGLPWVLTVGQVSLAGTFFIYAVVGLSLLILTGWAGQISLGQWGFAAIGAWVVAVSGLPLLIALPLAGLVGAVISIVVGFPALKLRGLQLGVATLAFAWSATFVLFDDQFLGSHVPTSLENTNLLWLDLGDVKVGYYAALVFLVLFVLATIGLRRSRFGRALIAVRSNDEGAEAFGIDPRWLRLTAFAVAGAYAAIAGGMFAAHLGSVQPQSFTADESLTMFMFTVIGGLGSVAGPLIGFTALAILTFASSNPLVAFFGAGVGGILLLVVAPGGLVEIFQRIRDAALRRLAIRHRIPAASLLGDRAANRLQDHAVLREYSGGQEPVLPPVRYEPKGQWALERYGLEGATEERVGAGGGKGTTNGKPGASRSGDGKRS